MGRTVGQTNCKRIGKNTLFVDFLFRYWHTIRHLKPIQFYARLWHRFYSPIPDLRSAPCIRRKKGVWRASACSHPSMLGPKKFKFLSVEGALSEVGWDGPQRDKLWRYNQHYFDYLNAGESVSRKDWQLSLLSNWILNNEPGKGNGWEPYPTSLRIVNWIKWSLSGNTLSPDCQNSLAVQARWLSKRLEHHLLGNHLFANAKALIFAGVFFEGLESDAWFSTGMKILNEQVPEQILADGGHFERSTMYHALIFEDMLDLCNLAETHPDRFESSFHQTQLEDWYQKIPKMCEWMQAMNHLDGEISFFNDAALGISLNGSELIEYGHRLGFDVKVNSNQSVWMQESGYARILCDNALAILDLAPIAPDYLPGHGHADTLSFELSIFGHRILVNSGTSCYGTSNERLRQRATSAHNTVTINEENSSEVWGGFRVARRARVLSPKVDLQGKVKSAVCSHDGYKRLAGKPIHKREWKLSDDCFVVRDEVSSKHVSAVARFHFHPSLDIISVTEDLSYGYAILPCGRKVKWKIELGLGGIENTSWHPKFGISIPSKCLKVKLINGSSQICWSWN